MAKKGQMTIFIIVAAVIVAALFLFFFAFRKAPTIEVPAEANPQLFIQKCVREKTTEAVEKMLPQGGFIEPGNYVLYQNKKVVFLCENIGWYNPCINQHPMYINELGAEIKNYISPYVEGCFSTLKSELEKRNFAVDLAVPTNISIELMPSRVDVAVEKKLVMQKGDETRKFERFEVRTGSHLYELANVAIEAVNMEVMTCNFEYVGYHFLYNQFDIEKYVMSDSTKIYSVRDTRSGEKLYFAIRGCAIPAGA